MVMSYFQRVRAQWKVESYNTMGTQKKNDANSVGCFCGQRNTLFEAVRCFYQYCPCQKAGGFVTDVQDQRVTKKRELDKLRKQDIQEKV